MTCRPADFARSNRALYNEFKHSAHELFVLMPYDNPLRIVPSEPYIL